MAELDKKSSKNHKRAMFPKGEQKEFLELARKTLDLNLGGLAQVMGVHIRTLTDWRREKYFMSLPALRNVCRKTGVSMPKNIKTLNPFWYVSVGSSLGGVATYKKYGRIGGDPTHRKRMWYKWWETTGKFKKHPIINVHLPIILPSKSSELAEFVGILLGDGGITKGQVTITLHKKDDKEFSVYVKNLTEKLFSVSPSVRVRKKENTVNIVVSRKKLVEFFREMGIVPGNKVKNQVAVPSWIQQSNSFTKSCLRGLLDTDGCVYIDRHTIKGKAYYNCGINFTNRSLPILSFFKNSLEKFGFHPTQKTQFTIFLRRENEIIRYFNEIGSSNPKHNRRFRDFTKIKNKKGGVG